MNKIELRKFNEELNRIINESDNENFKKLLSDFFGVDKSDIREATEKEIDLHTNMSSDCFYVKGNGLFEIVNATSLLEHCANMLEHFFAGGGMEESLVIDYLNKYVNDYRETLFEDAPENITKENYKKVLNKLNYEKLAETLLEEDATFSEEVGTWVNNYDGRIDFLGNLKGIDYYICRIGGINESKRRNENVEDKKVNFMNKLLSYDVDNSDKNMLTITVGKGELKDSQGTPYYIQATRLKKGNDTKNYFMAVYDDGDDSVILNDARYIDCTQADFINLNGMVDDELKNSKSKNLNEGLKKFLESDRTNRFDTVMKIFYNMAFKHFTPENIVGTNIYEVWSKNYHLGAFSLINNDFSFGRDNDINGIPFINILTNNSPYINEIDIDFDLKDDDVLIAVFGEDSTQEPEYTDVITPMDTDDIIKNKLKTAIKEYNSLEEYKELPMD